MKSTGGSSQPDVSPCIFITHRDGPDAKGEDGSDRGDRDGDASVLHGENDSIKKLLA